MTTEAEIRRMWPQVKKHQELPGAGRGRKGPPLQLPKGAPPCRLLDFGLQAPRAVRKLVSVVLSPPVCGDLLGQPQDTGPFSMAWMKLSLDLH